MATGLAPGRRRRVAEARSGVLRPVVRWSLRVLAWMVILAGVAVLAVTVVVPRVGGATTYAVLTGSMSPGLPPGTMVAVRPVVAQDVRPGTVITYQIASGEPTVVTHRVVAQRVTLAGDVEWQTRGDANGVPDERWVHLDQVRGALWYAVPHLGRVQVAVAGGTREWGVYAVAAALALYAGSMFAGASRDRARRRATAEDTSAQTAAGEDAR